MPTQHTLTPWKTCGSTPSLIEVNGHIFVQVTEVYDGSTDKERLAAMWANAAFIVQACNAHEELVEALKDMLAAYEVQDPFNSRGGIDFEGRYIGSDEKGQILLMRAEAKAKAAIAKAEAL